MPQFEINKILTFIHPSPLEIPFPHGIPSSYLLPCPASLFAWNSPSLPPTPLPNIEKIIEQGS